MGRSSKELGHFRIILDPAKTNSHTFTRPSVCALPNYRADSECDFTTRTNFNVLDKCIAIIVNECRQLHLWPPYTRSISTAEAFADVNKAEPFYHAVPG